MDLKQVLALYDQEQRRDIVYPDMRHESAPPVWRGIDPKGNMSFINYTELEGEDVDQVIEEQIRYFESIGQDFEWKTFSHDTPPDLRECLQSHGFECEEEETILILNLDTAPEALLQPVTHDIRRITDPSGIDDVMEVIAAVWEEDKSWLNDNLRDQLVNSPEHVSIYVAYADDRPVSYARITFHEGSQFAGLWGGSTLADYRSRGFYTALLAIRVQEARARGVRYLTIDASPMSRPIVEKFGFQAVSISTPCMWYVNRADE